MSRLSDDLTHRLRVLRIDQDDHKSIGERWPEIERDIGIQAHGKIAGSVAAALAWELLMAEQEVAELREELIEAWNTARLLREAM